MTGIDARRLILRALHAYFTQATAMPGTTVDDHERMHLRIKPELKAKLMRAAALRHTDLTDFVLETALREAEAVIGFTEQSTEQLTLSARDSLQGLELPENPPAPNARLLAAARALPPTA